MGCTVSNSWTSAGAFTASDGTCIKSCPADMPYYLADQFGQLCQSMCPSGYYRESESSLACTFCPGNSFDNVPATSTPGAIGSSTCACPQGQELVNNACVAKCPSNQVPNDQGVCVCPSGTSICASSGSQECKASCPTMFMARRSALVRARDLCEQKRGFSWCPLANGKGFTSDGFECVNTASGLETCGGCSSFYPSLVENILGSTSSLGVDCSSISYADSVSCLEGQCEVHSCERGFSVSADLASCVPYLS